MMTGTQRDEKKKKKKKKKRTRQLQRISHVRFINNAPNYTATYRKDILNADGIVDATIV